MLCLFHAILCDGMGRRNMWGRGSKVGWNNWWKWCEWEDKNKTNEMKSIWDGRVRTRKRGGETEMRMTKGDREVQGAHDLCSLCQGQSKGEGIQPRAGGMRQDQTKRKRRSEELVKEQRRKQMSFSVCHFQGIEGCSWTVAIKAPCLLGDNSLSVWLYNAKLIKCFDQWLYIMMDDMRAPQKWSEKHLVPHLVAGCSVAPTTWSHQALTTTLTTPFCPAGLADYQT